MAQIVDDTEAEGPGRRVALWVQGCSLRCAGCCNPEMFAPDAGPELELDAVVERVRAAARRGVEGLSILGGEPTEQAASVAAIARAARAAGLTVMVDSGPAAAMVTAVYRPRGACARSRTVTVGA